MEFFHRLGKQWVLKANQSFHLECRLRRKDGEYRTILCRGIPRFAPGGNFAGYIGSDIDITELQSEERFRQLAENHSRPN